MESLFKKSPYFISIALVCSVAALCYPFTGLMGYRAVALSLVLTVSVLAMRLSLYPVLLAAVLSALIWDFFFIPPRFTLSVSSAEDAFLLVMYFIVALLNGLFNYKLREFEQVARQKEERENVIKLYDTLFNSLSHELRTPIATIIGATDALQENAEKLTPLSKNELMDEISNAALRLNGQVENLLNMSRLESGFIKPNFEWCDANELIYDVLNKSKKDLIHHNTVVEIPENFPLVKLDFGLTEQVLSNLVKNAAIYAPINTQITIEAKILKDRTGHFDDDKNIVDTVTDKLILAISDEGKGFPIAEIAHIFEKFYRLKNTKAGGTGLGLYIAKGFIEAQGGTISAVNKSEGGAKFIIEIPTAVLTQNIHHD